VKTNLSISEHLLVVDFSNFCDQKKKNILLSTTKSYKKTPLFWYFFEQNKWSDSLNCECKRESGFIDSLYIE
jgi:hypothetical protein